MGLHLNYELRLPATTQVSKVDLLLARLRDHATSLPVARVSKLFGSRPVAADWQDTEDPLEGAFRLWSSIIAEPFENDTPRLIGDVETARGFSINPGRGSEIATVGFMKRADESGSVQEWFWYCGCKTQYASVISDNHLVVCHTSLINLLDRAIGLGIDVVVSDETRYWETRDEAQLIAEVQAMNRVVAAFAGKLSDAIEPKHAVVAPIFEHPRFERLEVGEQ
jgi:hypothetical protein